MHYDTVNSQGKSNVTDQNNNAYVTYFHTFTKLSHPPVTNLLTNPLDFDPG